MLWGRDVGYDNDTNIFDFFSTLKQNTFIEFKHIKCHYNFVALNVYERFL